MKKKISCNFRATLLLAAGVAALAGPVRASDQAVVVGINLYPKVGDDDANLKGCVPDAKRVETLVRKLGFNVTRLLDDQASKQGILQAIGKAAGQLKTGDRFLFYYAGHGTKHTDNKGALVPNDATTSEASDLGAEELRQALQPARAVSRSCSVILDSCFSGAMARGLRGRMRFLDRDPGKEFVKTRKRDTTVIQLVPQEVNGADTNRLIGSAQASGICYFTAASDKEGAIEDNVEGKDRGGVFTYALCKVLGSAGGKRDASGPMSGLSWADVQNQVAGEVMRRTDDLQHPAVSPPFLPAAVFESPAPPAPPVDPVVNPHPTPVIEIEKDVSVWNLYGSNHYAAEKILLALSPDKTVLKLQEQFTLRATVGMDGYLVILERTTDDDIRVLFPESLSINDAKVAAGGVVELPGKDEKGEPLVYENNKEGYEHAKAILFNNRSSAEQLLKSFAAKTNSLPKRPGETVAGCAMRFFVKAAPRQWFTSDINIHAIPGDDVLDHGTAVATTN